MTKNAAQVDTGITKFGDILAQLEPATSQAEAINRIQELERLKAICEAAQAKETAALEHHRLAEEKARGIPADRRGKGLSAELGLARQESPARGANHLELAQIMLADLPHTFAALQAGRIREEHAQAVVRETKWLSPTHRREVDVLLIDEMPGLGPRKLAAIVRAHAQRLDPAGAVERLAEAEKDRHVSIRPAPEGMAYLSALLPMKQAVAAYTALRRDAATMIGTGETADPHDPTGTPRSRNQVMADLFVQRLTGQSSAGAVPAEVNLLMTDMTLFNQDPTPAWLTGHGSMPAAAARDWLANPEMTVFLRRVFTDPKTQQLVGLESRAREFPPGLRRMVLIRDDTCRTPYCEAPIQDIDHITPVRKGGATTWENSSGLCARCNQTKENTGWEHHGNPEFLRITTPTGHHYPTTTPPVLPGRDVTEPPEKRKDQQPPEPPDEPTPPEGHDPPPEPDDDRCQYRRPYRALITMTVPIAA